MDKTCHVTLTNIDEWLEDNKDHFKLPVCLKTVYNSQLTMVFLQGPNQRDDFHIEEGDEIFYMIKGDMNLKIIEDNKFRNIIIKEGEIFVLPARVRHSPRRPLNSLGFVIERQRIKDLEFDGLIYYDEEMSDTVSEPIHEAYMYISENFEGEIEELVIKTTNDIANGNITSKSSKPVERLVIPDSNIQIGSPILLSTLIKQSEDNNQENEYLSMFGNRSQTKIEVLRKGEYLCFSPSTDMILWVNNGTASLDIDEKHSELKINEFYLVKAGIRKTLVIPQGSTVIRIQIIPKGKNEI